MQTNKLAFPLMERGSWLGVHRGGAGLSLSGSVVNEVLDSAESLLCVQQLAHKATESKTDPAF